MDVLSGEWKLWAVVNGLPALLGGLLFIGAPLVRRIAPLLKSPRWQWIGYFGTRRGRSPLHVGTPADLQAAVSALSLVTHSSPRLRATAREEEGSKSPKRIAKRTLEV